MAFWGGFMPQDGQGAGDQRASRGWVLDALGDLPASWWPLLLLDEGDNGDVLEHLEGHL